MKITVIGYRQGEAKEGGVLNRILRACKHGWECEGDQRHSDLLVKVLMLEDANTVSTRGEDPKKEREREESQLLEGDKIIAYRQLAARANYMAQDRPDIQFAVKELCRRMAMPTVGAGKQLKRLGRCVKGRPREILKFGLQESTSILDGSSDSDWAGCRRTARATSGGALMIENHMLKFCRSRTCGGREAVWREHWPDPARSRLGNTIGWACACGLFRSCWNCQSKRKWKTPPREGRHAVGTAVSGGGGDHFAEGQGREQRS